MLSGPILEPGRHHTKQEQTGDEYTIELSENSEIVVQEGYAPSDDGNDSGE